MIERIGNIIIMFRNVIVMVNLILLPKMKMDIFWEVKFKKDTLNDATIRIEINQVKDIGFNCYKYGFISHSGFEPIIIDNVILLTLDDVYYQG